ncbi:MAG: VWA domain-containing protein [Nanoarchaeota archaeon]|nr:VWA domain-containing protein [Nanoarchaeota archaeon]
MLEKLCWQGYCLSNPKVMLYALPLILVLAIATQITFMRFKTSEERKSHTSQIRVDRMIYTLLQSLIFLLILLAIATPYTIKQTTTQGDPSLTILVDNSTSFDLFDRDIASSIQTQLEEYFPVNVQTIASGTSSPIGDAIARHSKGDDNILVISDGQSNQGRDLGDIALFSSLLNTTIHTLKMSPIKEDAAVSISGPSQVIVKNEAYFNVKVTKVGSLNAPLEVFVDGAQVDVDKSGNFMWRFSLGSHKITARIKPGANDHFKENNLFYKSVSAVPRPKLLFVQNSDNPLHVALSRIYDVTTVSSIPSALSSYNAVLLDNLNVNSISNTQVDALATYTGENGKGVVVVGGDNAFDKGNYKGSYLESILPAQVGVGERSPGSETNVVIVIDISESTGAGFYDTSSNAKIKVEKALAINILQSLPEETSIGVVAFNHLGYVLARLDARANHWNISNKIASLRNTGGTLVYGGLYKAETLFKGRTGSKNIILISDGVTQQESSAFRKATEMAEQGIRIHTIGVGENTNEQFMKSLAAKGGGLYFQPSETSRVNIILGGAPEDKPDTLNLVIVDDDHWITKGDLELKAKVSGHNFILPKSSGRKLVTTDNDRSILIAGRFGLGRIVTLATDDGSKWSGELLSRTNSKLITRAVNWAIGDFTKDIDGDVRAQDTYLGKPTQVRIIASSQPEAAGVEFIKIDAGKYTATLNPTQPGFERILQTNIAVNGYEEYYKLGINPQLIELATISGGAIFDPSDIEAMKHIITENSKRTKIETQNVRLPLIIAALILFLLNLTFRRIRENKGG